MPRYGYSTEVLFNDQDWNHVEQSQLATLRTEIEGYDSNKLLNTAVEDLAEYFREKLHVEPIKLLEDQIQVDQYETEIDAERFRENYFMHGGGGTIKGTAVQYNVPFTGDAELFRVRPSTFSLSAVKAQIKGNELVFTFEQPQINEGQLKQQFADQLQLAQQNARNLATSVEHYNSMLLTAAKSAIEARRKRLLTAANKVANLGYPLRRRADAATTFAPPVPRRKPVPTPPPASSGPYKPEPALPQDDYDFILSKCENMAAIVERNPETFKTLGEEDIRNHFMMILNGDYDSTTGETFNKGGKTDILIRHEGKNIFIAECKFWHGEKGFAATIDQLLGYVTWRDTKTAILIFVRDVQMSTVLQKIPDALKAHPGFKREEGSDGETRFLRVFKHPDDPNHEIFVTTLVFHVPG